ncbi:hypothetical protein AArcSl_1751 [Halalkaliarchaeum desulfuricum]|uniref:ATP-binding protein n=1 Tax=Halalkaliarchaeum desulfuricum TaxID=2055893 RepID=A0A343TJV7_9EURY|nr:hypothetical protein AArcSl_1751 [Halalkaliarchaeum desulfuricum]
MATGSGSPLRTGVPRDHRASTHGNRSRILDLGGLNSSTRTFLSRVLVSRFFLAGRLRQRDGRSEGTRPLANLYLDEAHAIGDGQILLDLLAEGRAFDISVYLMSQLLEQFDEEAAAHIRGNVGTLLVGHADPPALEAVLDHQYDARTAARIAQSMPVGDWLVRIRAPREQAPIDPFVIAAPPLPVGHPDSPQREELSSGARAACERAVRECRERSRSRPWVVSTAVSETGTELSDAEIRRACRHTLWTSGTSLPGSVKYDAESDTVRCADDGSCGGSGETQFPPTFDGVWNAVSACSPEGAPSASDLPVVEIGLDVDPWAVKTAPVTVQQLMFLRLIERARRRAIDTRAWDIVTETMRPLRDATGCTAADETALEEQGLLALQSDLRGKYYHLTDDGTALLRKVRNGAPPPESKRGDPNESAAHIKGVEAVVRALQTLANADRSSVGGAIAQVERYWSPPDAQTRLDVVALDDDGSPVVTVEVERPTHDIQSGVPADYDAMAAVEPAAAVWVVTNRELGHRIVETLSGAGEGAGRLGLDVDAVRAATSPLDRYELDAPGCSAIRTLSSVSAELFERVLTADGG